MDGLEWHGIFDTHAHYDDERFDEDRDEVLASLPGEGVCAVVNAASDLPSARAGIALAERYPYIWAAAGIHPHEAEKAPADAVEQLRALLSHPRVVALGEIGLDYHYDFSPRDVQQALFERQLALAKELDAPVVIHDREAHEDTLRLLKKYRPRGVVHCFSGSGEMAAEILKLGMYIGLGGAVTFKNARKPVEVAAMVPADRLVLETDAPYMTPVPFRGRRCHSGHIRYTAGAIAAVRGITPQALIDQARANACRLYGIPESALSI
ncbi:MAG TPA: TatD family hydrolase [Firmicutes bacterium]|nr:TatD family hydrolase [Bacillota bacterium]